MRGQSYVGIPPPTEGPSGGTSVEKRVALVIGNGDYGRPATHDLVNPRNDAEKVAAILQRIGFSVDGPHHDLNLLKLGQRVADFGIAASSADMAVFYFAGHGFEVNRKNYLIPVDAELEHARRVPFEAIALDSVLSSVEEAKTLRLVILDACRDNPFASKTRGFTGSGLGYVEPEGNTVIAYAARQGTRAQDGPQGGNSPFAEVLTQYLETPDLEIRFLFGKVRDAVLQKTGRSQEPITYGSYSGEEIYLGGRTKQAEEAAEAEAHWRAFGPEDLNNPEIIGAWLARYGTWSPLLARQARGLLERIAQSQAEQEAHAWDTAVASGSAQAYSTYLQAWPKGQHADEARARSTDLLDEETWQRALERNVREEYETYLHKHPQGRYALKAQEALGRRTLRSEHDFPMTMSVVLGTLMLLMGVAFLAAPAALFYENDANAALALIATQSNWFLFFPVFGLLALYASYKPTLVTIHLYWYHVPFGKLRLLVSLVVLAGLSIAAARYIIDSPRVDLWSVTPVVITADVGEPPHCGQTNCERASFTRVLQSLRDESQKRIGLSNFALSCQLDPLLPVPITHREERFCFVAQKSLAVPACCAAQRRFDESLRALAGERSLTWKVFHYSAPAMVFFVFAAVGQAVLLASQRNKLDMFYGMHVPGLERSILVGAFGMLFWPLTDAAANYSTSVLFGNYGDHVRLSFVIVPWTLLLAFFFLRRFGKQAELVGQLAAVVASAILILRFQEIGDWATRLFGAGMSWGILVVLVSMASFAALSLWFKRSSGRADQW